MSEKIPEKIYLQWDSDPITWCEDQINDEDIKYILPKVENKLFAKFLLSHMQGMEQFDNYTNCWIKLKEYLRAFEND